MVTGKFGKPTVAEIVSCGRALSVISLERAHDIFGVVHPEPGFFSVVLEILLKRLFALARHCQVAGQNVIKRWNISRTLNRSVTA